MSESTTSLTLNGEPVVMPAGRTLADLITGRGDDAQTLATALNGSFVPRTQRAHTYLQDGDAVIVFKAIVGG